MSITVLLVDDHELIRQGLAEAFGRREGLEVVAQAATLAQARAAWAAHRPRVVVTDLQLPDGTGLDLARAIRAESDDAGIVMLTMHAGDDQLFAAMEAGVSAFVGKDRPADDVVTATEHAASSPRSFVSAGLIEAVARKLTAPAVPRLSPREREILDLLAEGLGTAEVAKRLYLGESTAKTHIARIYEKLGVANRAQALVAAMRLGLLDHLG